ncbi:dTDP-4-dehydrorhamnose reductase [Pseudooceanicola sp.]|uniref:dTDP-4-dehydrorhamnose reductase n=1 Tax=Pseudooceanicola sp. TaxID=1914328 RepID=UPI004059438D
MTVLVFGRTGQVARALAVLGPDAVFLGRDEADLRDPSTCSAAIRARRPHAVINAAAWTAVDDAESHEAEALVINGEAPAAMARACAALAIPFVHISTDYVFAGGGDTPWRSDDPVAPCNAYGRTKRAGEVGIIAAGGAFGILRTSWVFSATGVNFLKTMLRLSETRDRLSVVGDQIGGPTPATAIAAVCLTMAETLHAEPDLSGIYHLSGDPDVSWAGFAREIFAQAGRSVTVEDIPSHAYPQPAPRPANSRLDCSGLTQAFGIARPDWRAEVGRILNELGAVT